MIGYREIKQVVMHVWSTLQPQIRTHLIGQVVSYDPEVNTAEIQPVTTTLRTRDPVNLTTKQLPVLRDVPVEQRGSGKLWMTVAPAVGSYGVLHVYDREIETWLANGGIVDPNDPRMHNLSDVSFTPGMTPLKEDGDKGLIAEPIETDRVSMRTRSGVTKISVIDDETVEIINEKATITIDVDGNVSIETEGDITMTADGNVTTAAAETVIQAGADYAVQYTALKSAFDQFKSDFDNFVTITYNTHMHPTAAVGAPSVPTVTGLTSTADMSGAKVSDVRLP